MDHVLTGPCSGSQEFTLSSQSVSPTLTNMEINGNSKVHPPHSNAKPSARIDSSSTSSSSTRRGDTWPLEDDLWLHAHRSMSVHQLAAHFERNQGAIRSRLKHLRTPEHPACVRLQQEYSTTGRNEVGEIIDRSSSANHKSIKQEEGANRDPGEEQQEQGRQNEEVKKYDEAEADPVDNVMSLSLKQNEVLKHILEGRSVFFTGAAGTGKSHILHTLHRILQHQGCSGGLAFTAPTGVAACNIRGLTIHSWAGIGLGRRPAREIALKINNKARDRWLQANILVIDEISMLSARIFDLVSDVGSLVRKNDRPFGGLQVVLCGDFFQLPPVCLSSEGWTFKATAWQRLFQQGPKASNILIVLDQVFRQKNPMFLQMLHEIRRGVVSTNTRNVLSKKVAADYRREVKRKATLASLHQERGGGSDEVSQVEEAKAAIQATKLFGTNAEVGAVNRAELAKLPGTEYVFEAIDNGKQPYLSQLQNGTKFPETLTLKEGAQVMLLYNLNTSEGLVNGARGRVVAMEESDGRSAAFSGMIPVVEFVVIVGGDDNAPPVMHRLAIGEKSVNIEHKEKIVASRSQLPLMLAYAVTIHKSQGMTLPFLEISMRGVFECGQAYVALSRATTLDGMLLKTFDAARIKAHPAVQQFYASLGYSGECSQSAATTVVTSVRQLSVLRSGGGEVSGVRGSVGYPSCQQEPLRGLIQVPPASPSTLFTREQQEHVQLQELHAQYQRQALDLHLQQHEEEIAIMEQDIAEHKCVETAWPEVKPLPRLTVESHEQHRHPRPGFGLDTKACDEIADARVYFEKKEEEEEEEDEEGPGQLGQLSPQWKMAPQPPDTRELARTPLVATATPTANVTSKSALSEEQKRKIEVNKKNAIERLRAKRIKYEEESSTSFEYDLEV